MNHARPAEEFEKYRLNVQVHPDHSVQFVHDPSSNITARQTWQRRKHLGKGGFGSVWQEGWEDADGDWHYRAVKICSEQEMQVRRIDYKRELLALAAFSNSNVSEMKCISLAEAEVNSSQCSGLFVNLHGWWTDAGNIFVAMEYLGHGDMSRYATAGVPETDMKDVIKDVLRGLEFMHQKGFTHRDIKPQVCTSRSTK